MTIHDRQGNSEAYDPFRLKILPPIAAPVALSDVN